jgi:hypothetical protein
MSCQSCVTGSLCRRRAEGHHAWQGYPPRSPQTLKKAGEPNGPPAIRRSKTGYAASLPMITYYDYNGAELMMKRSQFK